MSTQIASSELPPSCPCGRVNNLFKSGRIQAFDSRYAKLKLKDTCKTNGEYILHAIYCNTKTQSCTIAHAFVSYRTSSPDRSRFSMGFDFQCGEASSKLFPDVTDKYSREIRGAGDDHDEDVTQDLFVEFENGDMVHLRDMIDYPDQYTVKISLTHKGFITQQSDRQADAKRRAMLKDATSDLCDDDKPKGKTV